MKELYGIMAHPRVYLFIQKALGADRLRTLCLQQAAIQPGERVLDLGCGPGQIVESLPRVDYVGFDTEDRYIRYARQHYGERGQFHGELFTERHARSMAPFDAVLLFGILHHADDGDAAELVRRAALSLKAGGRMVTLDPCYTDDQSAIARKVAQNDRGRFVRRAEGYRRLVDGHFSAVQETVVHNVCRIPSTELILRATAPRQRVNPA